MVVGEQSELQQHIVGLVASFVGGFLMTWLRGWAWFNEGLTGIVALLCGAWCSHMMGGAFGSLEWSVQFMEATLMVYGAVHVGGTVAKKRAETNLPAWVAPKFNELAPAAPPDEPPTQP